MSIRFAHVCFSFLIFLLTAFPALADQLIVEPDMGRKPIINAIKNTRHTLSLVMYGFTDESLLDALIRQQKQGKTVKVILEEQPYKAENENNKTIRTFNQNEVAWQGHIPPFRLIHQKTLVIDGNKAIVMTFNFTRSAFKNDRNFALIIDDPQRINEIAATFASDWNHQPTANHADQLVWSPDNSREQLLKIISGAKQSLKIYAQTISDYKIVGALAKAARKGVNVQILTSNRLRDKQADYLARAGVVVRRSNRYYIHAKVMIVDNQKAVLGSVNLTRASLDDNRELAVITKDSAVIQQLTATFDQDFRDTEKTHTQNHSGLSLNKAVVRQVIRFIHHSLKSL